MKKTLLSLAAILAGSACYAAVGDTVELNGITYTAVSSAEAEVSKASNEVVTAVIPETVEIGGDKLTVTAIGEQAFYWSNIKSVELPNTLTEIKRQGFYNCSRAEVKWGTGLKTIGDYGMGYTQFTSI
ncbi:MAG: leucine-rich repeat domain-containing protein, partial [Muribaculaceae bacterium]|nr:leucine-rich repeat domain-containing protein [Muribaculaceae bacterium]